MVAVVSSNNSSNNNNDNNSNNNDNDVTCHTDNINNTMFVYRRHALPGTVSGFHSSEPEQGARREMIYSYLP